MSRLTVFSLCAALAGAVQVSPAGANPAGPPQSRDRDDAGMAAAIESTVADVFQSTTPAVVRVESDDELGKVAGTGAAREVGMRQGREVQLRQRHIGEERPAGGRLALHEVDRPARELAVDESPLV